ncbi:MAG: hypothetical protein WA964_14680 [Ilumatobacter sp.]|uniref:hypothetical protein n=1 Tax=Ilumatobacter sp. TaxID=1967498 RepID=UPI003C714CB9
MSDDALIAGAAAPVGQRWIRSTAVLDAGWVVVASCALIVSAFFALVDLPTARLRTGDDPLRFFALGLPVIAIVVAAIGAARGSVVLVAVATGIATPGFALAGSLGASLLLSEASAFADAGVAISITASFIGIVMLVRWFVYHPIPLLGDQTRPVPRSGHALIALGGLLAVILLVSTVSGDTSWSTASVGQTVLMSTVAAVVAAAGVTRTIAAAWLACAASAAQLVAVLVVKAEQSTIPFDSDLVLRTGPAGLVALAVTAAASSFAAVRVAVDVEPDVVEDDTAPWRWNVDD